MKTSAMFLVIVPRFSEREIRELARRILLIKTQERKQAT
jgi:hypothetical protein